MSGGDPEQVALGSGPTLKNCAACGESFSCGAPAAGCWCEELQVAAEVLRELRARYADCLCRRCLTAVAASSRPSAKRASRAGSESTSVGAGRNILPQHLL
jgi:hypothetical protein